MGYVEGNIMKPPLSKQEVERQYQAASVLRGSELYLEPKVALDFVATCQANDLCVVGIEGFELQEGILRPQMDLIADWSSARADTWDEYRDRCNQLSVELIKRLPDKAGLVLNLTVLSQADLKRYRAAQKR